MKKKRKISFQTKKRTRVRVVGERWGGGSSTEKTKTLCISDGAITWGGGRKERRLKGKKRELEAKVGGQGGEGKHFKITFHQPKKRIIRFNSLPGT